MKNILLIIIPIILISCNDPNKNVAANNACKLIDAYHRYEKERTYGNIMEVTMLEGKLSDMMDLAGFENYEELDPYMKDSCDYNSEDLVHVLSIIKTEGLSKE